MNSACYMCKGACCRSVVIFLGDGGNDLQARDIIKFVKLHGEEISENKATRFESPCRALCDGQCTMYDDRPRVCRSFFVGSEECIKCVDRYHSPEDAVKIKAMFGEELT
jgi:Fe-S-cluster containining protein